MEKGLEMLQEIKDKYDLPIVTDIHTPDQAAPVAEVADILQIPAFLCRQTDLLVAAAKTGKIVNIKKGQFLAPEQMGSLVKKVEDSGNSNIMLTDRGTSFGYNNLVTDFRGIPLMQEFGYPVVFDATHSVQLPGANGLCSGGDRRFVPVLAKAAMAVGANVLFFEIHPDPDKALCDGPNMVALKDAKELFSTCKKIFELVREDRVMILKTYVEGPIDANNYLLIDEDSKEAVLIDCSAARPELIEEIKNLGVKLKYILLTHGHFDHILGVEKFKEVFRN